MTILDISQTFFYFSAGVTALAGLAIYKGSTTKYLYALKYPPSEVNKTYKLLKTATSDKIYLIDIKANTKRWISSSSTFIELGFNIVDVKVVSQKELSIFRDKLPIFTY